MYKIVNYTEKILSVGAVKIVSKVNNLGFVLNERLTAADHFRKVCQKVRIHLRSLRPHVSHTPFEVRKRLSLILLHIDYGNIVFADAASRSRVGVAFRACLRYIHMRGRFDHVSHLESTVMGVTQGISDRIQLRSFLYKVLHVCHSCYLFSLFYFILFLIFSSIFIIQN
jgi:hypothetical protein